jgi:hypothetical protein
MDHGTESSKTVNQNKHLIFISWFSRVFVILMESWLAQCITYLSILHTVILLLTEVKIFPFLLPLHAATGNDNKCSSRGELDGTEAAGSQCSCGTEEEWTPCQVLSTHLARVPPHQALYVCCSCCFSLFIPLRPKTCTQMFLLTLFKWVPNFIQVELKRQSTGAFRSATTWKAQF